MREKFKNLENKTKEANKTTSDEINRPSVEIKESKTFIETK